MIDKILRGIGTAALVVLLMAAGPGLYTGSVSIPATGTFTTASTINAAAGTNLTLNNLSAGGGVLTHYGDGAYAGFYALDGGTTNYSELRGVGGLTFSSGGSYYSSTTANVSGALSANSVSATSGVIGGDTLSGSTVTAPSSVSTATLFTGNVGVEMTNATAGGNTILGTGGGAVAGIAAQAFYVYTPNTGIQQMAVDDNGNLGLNGSLYASSAHLSGLSASQGVCSDASSPPILVSCVQGSVYSGGTAYPSARISLYSGNTNGSGAAAVTIPGISSVYTAVCTAVDAIAEASCQVTSVSGNVVNVSTATGTVASGPIFFYLNVIGQ